MYGHLSFLLYDRLVVPVIVSRLVLNLFGLMTGSHCYCIEKCDASLSFLGLKMSYYHTQMQMNQKWFDESTQMWKCTQGILTGYQMDFRSVSGVSIINSENA